MPTPFLLERITRPARVPLEVTRGDSLLLALRLRDKAAGGVPVPLDGREGTAVIRPAFDFPVLYELTVTVSQATTGSTVGEILVQATGQQTNLFPEVGVWDLQLSDGTPEGTFRKTVIQGPICIGRDVTPQ